MCGRFAITQTDFTYLEKVLGSQLGPVTPRYNIAPTSMIPVIRPAEQGYVMEDMRWGLVPSWSKEPLSSYATFNARVETVATKPAFRNAFRKRRCIIPASGFYEWHTDEQGNKQPYYFHLKEGHEMALAGLWEAWQGQDGSVLHSCTILVGGANETVGRLHDRMATILSKAHIEDWLNPAESTDYLLALLSQPFVEEEMEAIKVSRKVNSVRNQSSDVLLPVS
jgi:putative SOS response-associated peptidase YedK